MLLDDKCVHVLLRDRDEPAGYLLAIPHSYAAADPELMEADPLFQPDPERYYVETISITPKVANRLSGGKLFFKMLHTMIDEVERRFGINKFSMHVRVETERAKRSKDTSEI